MCDQPMYYKVIAKRLRPFKLGIDGNSPYYNDHLKCLNDVVNNMPLDNELTYVRLDIERSEEWKLVFDGDFYNTSTRMSKRFKVVVKANFAFDFTMEVTADFLTDKQLDYVYESFEYALQTYFEEY